MKEETVPGLVTVMGTVQVLELVVSLERRLSSKCRWTCLPAVEQTKPGKFP
jgi:hypothetical protein